MANIGMANIGSAQCTVVKESKVACVHTQRENAYMAVIELEKFVDRLVQGDIPMAPCENIKEPVNPTVFVEVWNDVPKAFEDLAAKIRSCVAELNSKIY